MTDLDDLEWAKPEDDPTRPERTPRGCRRHEWVSIVQTGEPGTYDHISLPRCARCGKDRNAEGSRRGKNNRARGLSIQREVNRKLGVSNIAGNAQNHDGGRYDEPFVTESKSGAAFSDRYWRWLKGIPASATQTPILVVADTPGPGVRRRAIVVLDLDDFIDLHGPVKP